MTSIAVATTVGSLAEAQALARAMVERKLAACAQISEIESFYRWQGRVQNEKEFRVLFKTTAENYSTLEQAIKAIHPYELPAIYAIALTPVFAPYAAWIADSCVPQ